MYHDSLMFYVFYQVPLGNKDIVYFVDQMLRQNDRRELDKYRGTSNAHSSIQKFHIGHPLVLAEYELHDLSVVASIHENPVCKYLAHSLKPPLASIQEDWHDIFTQFFIDGVMKPTPHQKRFGMKQLHFPRCFDEHNVIYVTIWFQFLVHLIFASLFRHGNRL